MSDQKDSKLPNWSTDGVPGAWLDDEPDREENEALVRALVMSLKDDDKVAPLDSHKTKAKGIAEDALTELSRALIQLNEEQIRRETLREQHAVASKAEKAAASTAPKGNKNNTPSNTPSQAKERLHPFESLDKNGKGSSDKARGHFYTMLQTGVPKAFDMEGLMGVQPFATEKAERERFARSMRGETVDNDRLAAARARLAAQGQVQSSLFGTLGAAAPQGNTKQAVRHEGLFQVPVAQNTPTIGGAAPQGSAPKPAREVPVAPKTPRLPAHQFPVANSAVQMSTQGKNATRQSTQSNDAPSALPGRPRSGTQPIYRVTRRIVDLGSEIDPAVNLTKPDANVALSPLPGRPRSGTQPIGRSTRRIYDFGSEIKPAVNATKPDINAAKPDANATKSSTKSAAADPVTKPSLAITTKAKDMAQRFARANIDSPVAPAVAAQGTDKGTAHVKVDAGKQALAPKKAPAVKFPKATDGLDSKLDAAKTAELDDSFDIISDKAVKSIPSATNGGLPNPDDIMDQLDEQFSPTLKSLKDWDLEDDLSDDEDQWDMGGLAPWNWVGEKSAKASKAKKSLA